MYNAFVTKKWQETIIPLYKDGNQYNCVLANLYVPAKVFHSEYADRMTLLADVYEANFYRGATICNGVLVYALKMRKM